MALLGWLALVLLPLVGYSAGMVLCVGQRGSPKPAVRDLLMLPLAWAAMLGLRMALELSHWVSLAAGLMVGLVLGWALGRFYPCVWPLESGVADEGGSTFRRLVEWWKRFAVQLGDYQSRLILGYFYFVVALPFGLMVRLVVDPMRLRRPPASSFWVERPAAGATIDDARSQF
jgi:hypothetical protein